MYKGNNGCREKCVTFKKYFNCFILSIKYTIRKYMLSVVKRIKLNVIC